MRAMGTVSVIFWLFIAIGTLVSMVMMTQKEEKTNKNDIKWDI